MNAALLLALAFGTIAVVGTLLAAAHDLIAALVHAQQRAHAATGTQAPRVDRAAAQHGDAALRPAQRTFVAPRVYG